MLGGGSRGESRARRGIPAFDWLGITDTIHTHISMRVPGRHDQFLLLPYGILFGEARASQMVKRDTEGKIVSDPTGLGISVGGFCIHSAIHTGRDDAVCIMHAHTEATIAVANMKSGLLPLSQHALRFHGRIAYMDYCGMFNSPEKRARLPEELGDAHVLMLRNHGPLVVASTPWECFSRMYYLERACRMQVTMLSAVNDPREELLLARRAELRGDGQGVRRSASRRWPGANGRRCGGCSISAMRDIGIEDAMRPSLLVHGGHLEKLREEWRDDYDIHLLRDYPDVTDFLRTAGADMEVIVSDGHALPPDLLAAMPRLRLVACFSTGYEGIDAAVLRSRGIALTTAAGVNAHDVADHALALMLAAWNGLIPAHAAVQKRSRGETRLRLGGRCGGDVPAFSASGASVRPSRRGSSRTGWTSHGTGPIRSRTYPIRGARAFSSWRATATSWSSAVVRRRRTTTRSERPSSRRSGRPACS